MFARLAAAIARRSSWSILCAAVAFRVQGVRVDLSALDHEGEPAQKAREPQIPVPNRRHFGFGPLTLFQSGKMTRNGLNLCKHLVACPMDDRYPP
jgi:hypothetical protein